MGNRFSGDAGTRRLVNVWLFFSCLRRRFDDVATRIKILGPSSPRYCTGNNSFNPDSCLKINGQDPSISSIHVKLKINLKKNERITNRQTNSSGSCFYFLSPLPFRLPVTNKKILLQTKVVHLSSRGRVGSVCINILLAQPDYYY